jgi:branched-subunit amino acid transport protein AzlD
MSHSNTLASIFLMAFIILLTRILPFLFFRKKNLPEILNYLERNIPPLIILLLVFYCLKDVRWTSAPYGLVEFGAIAVVVIVHLWKSNALLSIVSGTAMYMFILKVLVST